DDWLRFLLAMARAGGTVTVIHRYDRKDDVIAGLGGAAGGLVVFPLWPKIQGQAAKRVIVQGRKDGVGRTRTAAGLVLHNDDGSYTAEAEAVLRNAGPLTL
ncbi:MAG: methyltransferase, partial [Proteobacteria bacterium]|nr:methyltransferase [Pseudomonadota bacterium]